MNYSANTAGGPAQTNTREEFIAILDQIIETADKLDAELHTIGSILEQKAKLAA